MTISATPNTHSRRKRGRNRPAAAVPATSEQQTLAQELVRRLVADDHAAWNAYNAAFAACERAGYRGLADGVLALLQREERNWEPEETRERLGAELRRMDGKEAGDA